MRTDWLGFLTVMQNLGWQRSDWLESGGSGRRFLFLCFAHVDWIIIHDMFTVGYLIHQIWPVSVRLLEKTRAWMTG